MSAAFLIELSSIAQGYLVLNECLKASPVQIIEASALTPGKFMVFLKGSLKDIEKSQEVALRLTVDHILDSTILPNLDPNILEALYGLSKVEAQKDGVVVLETSGLSSMLLGLHQAKAQKAISVIEVRPGRGIGGKSTAFFTGNQKDMHDALDIFTRAVKPKGAWINGQLIPNPHPEFMAFFNISGAN